MDQDGDEDLQENEFMKLLLSKKYKKLYGRIETNRLTLCVPASGTVGIAQLTDDDLESHVFQNTSGAIRTLNGKSVLVNGNELSTGAGFKVQRKARILFEVLFVIDASHFLSHTPTAPACLYPVRNNQRKHNPPTRFCEQGILKSFSYLPN